MKMLRFRCKNIGYHCPFEVESDSENELKKIVAEHLEQIHKKSPVSPDMDEKIRKAIQLGKRGRQRDTFEEQVWEVLKRRTYEGPCPVLDHLIYAIDENLGHATSHVRAYKYLGLVLLTAMPIISASLSVLVGLKGGAPVWAAMILPLSVVLTFITVLNSIYKPSARFHDACIIGIEIKRFKADFLASLDKLDPIDDKSLAQLVLQKWEGFERYQRELIGLLMPGQTSVQPEPKPGNRS